MLLYWLFLSGLRHIRVMEKLKYLKLQNLPGSFTFLTVSYCAEGCSSYRVLNIRIPRYNDNKITDKTIFYPACFSLIKKILNFCVRIRIRLQDILLARIRILILPVSRLKNLQYKKCMFLYSCDNRILSALFSNCGWFWRLRRKILSNWVPYEKRQV